jgi:hypothetical protein
MARSDELRRCATALGEKRSSQRHQQQPRHHRAGGRPARPAARRRPGTSCSACPGAYSTSASNQETGSTCVTWELCHVTGGGH